MIKTKKLMKNAFFTVLVICFITTSCEKTTEKEVNVIQYVDPMIGTDGTGHTFPGATTPFGMVQLSPSDDIRDWDFCSGYHYTKGKNQIKGFAHNHYSGTGIAGMGDILLMPTTGELKLIPGTPEDPDMGYRSRFSHDNEFASVGYYSVLLSDYNVKAELTATPRVGVHRYTFTNAGEHRIIIDPTHRARSTGRTKNTTIDIISDTEVVGSKECADSGGHRTVYFYAKFSEPIAASGIAVNGEIVPEAKSIENPKAVAYVSFHGEENHTIEVKVAISHVSQDGAVANYNAEANTKKFDQVHSEAKALWKDKVSKIIIDKEATKAQKRTFYTAMYHSFIAPNLISDVDGKYVVNGKITQSQIGDQYSTFSTWDTYRATHPLWTIIEQKMNTHFVNVLVSRDTESDIGIPVWECLGYDNYCMIGFPGISAMAEAALKHPEGLDKELVYQSIKKAASDSSRVNPNPKSRRYLGMKEYIENNGFMPADVGLNVAMTTEYNYHDYNVAMLAKELGYQEDVEYFTQRSKGYRRHFHPEKKYLLPRYANGDWYGVDVRNWDDFQRHYTAGNMFGFSAYFPHDVEAGIEMYGGKEAFAEWLDNLFSDTTKLKGKEHVDISGFIGRYAQGDEPSHHIPYLYNKVDQPWKTQELVDRIMTEFYNDTPAGITNNEDCGQMSSWYIFSALGFYPVSPIDLEYYIGAPLYKEATLNLENGKTFTVIANNNSPENKYVQSITLNGQPYDKFVLAHEVIVKGGKLVFEMGNQPNKK